MDLSSIAKRARKRPQPQGGRAKRKSKEGRTQHPAATGTTEALEAVGAVEGGRSAVVSVPASASASGGKWQQL